MKTEPTGNRDIEYPVAFDSQFTIERRDRGERV